MRMTPEPLKVEPRSGGNAAGQRENGEAQALEAKGDAKATYVMLLNFTDQGVLHVKDTANRASHYKELAAKLGCTVKENCGSPPWLLSV
jgi:hypothetical protein